MKIVNLELDFVEMGKLKLQNKVLAHLPQLNHHCLTAACSCLKLVSLVERLSRPSYVFRPLASSSLLRHKKLVPG